MKKYSLILVFLVTITAFGQSNPQPDLCGRFSRLKCASGVGDRVCCDGVNYGNICQARRACKSIEQCTFGVCGRNGVRRRCKQGKQVLFICCEGMFDYSHPRSAICDGHLRCRLGLCKQAWNSQVKVVGQIDAQSLAELSGLQEGVVKVTNISTLAQESSTGGKLGITGGTQVSGPSNLTVISGGDGAMTVSQGDQSLSGRVDTITNLQRSQNDDAAGTGALYVTGGFNNSNLLNSAIKHNETEQLLAQISGSVAEGGVTVNQGETTIESTFQDSAQPLKQGFTNLQNDIQIQSDGQQVVRQIQGAQAGANETMTTSSNLQDSHIISNATSETNQALLSVKLNQQNNAAGSNIAITRAGQAGNIQVEGQAQNASIAQSTSTQSDDGLISQSTELSAGALSGSADDEWLQASNSKTYTQAEGKDAVSNVTQSLTQSVEGSKKTTQLVTDAQGSSQEGEFSQVVDSSVTARQQINGTPAEVVKTGGKTSFTGTGQSYRSKNFITNDIVQDENKTNAVSTATITVTAYPWPLSRRLLNWLT